MEGERRRPAGGLSADLLLLLLLVDLVGIVVSRIYPVLMLVSD